MQINKIILFNLLFIVYETIAKTSDILRVTLPNDSKLLGRYLTSLSGNGIRGFLGVPYGKPPTGNLRFRSPEPALPWSDERSFINDGNVCPQWSSFETTGKSVGDEDCLYLNVFTPLNVSGKLLPVMVYIHGGAFAFGTGMMVGEAQPDYLLDNGDIIMVSINYRLGILGFLSSGQDDCPGNFGLKDQLLALKWIQENIKAFGGDPKQVTLFGESAGAASITFLMATSLARGLFNKAIVQSGTYLNPWGYPARLSTAQKNAKLLATRLGCSDDENEIAPNWERTMDCLREVPTSNFTEIIATFKKWIDEPIVVFGPVIEELSYPLVTEFDLSINNAKHIQLLMGLNHDEGALKIGELVGNRLLRESLKKYWSLGLPIMLFYDHLPEAEQTNITNQINTFYFNSDEPNFNDIDSFTKFFGDRMFLIGMDKFIQTRLTSSNSNANSTYVYLLSHQSGTSFTDVFGGDPNKSYGVSHGDDLQYLFPLYNRYFKSSVPTEFDKKFTRIILDLWINFAKTGKPSSDNTDLPVTWNAATKYPYEYLRMGNKNQNVPIFEMEQDLWRDRVQFWNELNLTNN